MYRLRESRLYLILFKTIREQTKSLPKNCKNARASPIREIDLIE